MAAKKQPKRNRKKTARLRAKLKHKQKKRRARKTGLLKLRGAKGRRKGRVKAARRSVQGVPSLRK